MACYRYSLKIKERAARYRITLSLALLFLLLLAGPSPAPTAWAVGRHPAKAHQAKEKSKKTPVRTISFDYRMRADGHNEFLIFGDAPMNDYKTFLLTNPPRLALDIPGVTLPGNTAELPVNGPELSRIRIARYPDKVRFVFDLAEGKNVRNKVVARDKELKVLLSLSPEQLPPRAATTTDAPNPLGKKPSPSSEQQLQALATPDLEKIFGTQRISVIFHKTPIREFAQYLAGKSGRPIEVSPELATSVSLRFTEVPFHTLVNAAANTIGFVLRQDGERLVLHPADQPPLAPPMQKKGGNSQEASPRNAGGRLPPL